MSKPIRVGISTFWDTGRNYGQLLQAYALQKYLRDEGYDVFLVEYFRGASSWKNSTSLFSRITHAGPVQLVKKVLKKVQDSIVPPQDKELVRRMSFDAFRKEHFISSPRKYYSFDELRDSPPRADLYICGSDQIWNHLLNKNPKPYFLAFGPETAKRVAYAASFGHADLPDDIKIEYAGYLSRFDAIGARETSGVRLCDEMGRDDAVHVPDPTLLLSAETWKQLMPRATQFKRTDAFKVFVYVIGNRSDSALPAVFTHLEKRTDAEVRKVLVGEVSDGGLFPSIGEWLKNVAESDVVVTNSFHGIVFSIIFKKRFIALSSSGEVSGMNERMTSLLEKIGLRDRLLAGFDESRFEQLMNEQIDWSVVEPVLSEWIAKAKEFLIIEKYL